MQESLTPRTVLNKDIVRLQKEIDSLKAELLEKKREISFLSHFNHRLLFIIKTDPCFDNKYNKLSFDMKKNTSI